MSMQSPNIHLFRATSLAILIAVGFATLVAAQNDPFAMPSAASTPSKDKANGGVTLEPIPADLPKATRLVIESLRASNLESLENVCRAVRVSLNLEVYADTRYYLVKLQESLKSDEDRLAAQTHLGADNLMSIQLQQALQPLGSSVALDIVRGARRAAYAPARLERLIKDLSLPDDSRRGAAFRSLRRLGSPAAAAILSVFADSTRQSEFPSLRGALQMFGEPAIAPLVGGARASNSQIQIEAYRALTKYPSEVATDALIRAYHSPKFPESFKTKLQNEIAGIASFPGDRTAAAKQLYRRAYEGLTGQRVGALSSANSNLVWSWNPSTRLIEPVELDSVTVAQIQAANRASDLFEIAPSPSHRQLFLLTQLESAKRLLGPSNRVSKSRFESMLPGLNVDELDQALGRALSLDLLPAACGACELLGQFKEVKALHGSNGKRSKLVEAIMAGDRHLQFAALEAISEIDPHQPFNGTSYVTTLAVYLASGGGQNAGLVGHQLTSMGQSYASMLIQTGHIGIASNDSRDFFKKATTNPDLKFIVISDTMNLPDSIELAQQLRSDWRTKRLPINMVVTGHDSAVRMESVFSRTPGVFVNPYSVEPGLVHQHVREMLQAVPSWPVTPEDRRRHGLFAMGWLERIASDRDTYRFYELGGHEEALTKLIYIPGFSQVAAKVLSALGTAAAQREMLNFASQNNLPIDERQPIAEAFIKSIEKSGTLLSRKEIRMQYDRYNASQYASKPQQEILGLILDAIEAQASK